MRIGRVFLAVVVTAGLPALGHTQPLEAGAFLTYRTRGEQTVYDEGRNLGTVSVFAYHVTEEGDVLAPTPWVPDTADRLMADPRGHKFYVTVNNRILGPDGRPSPFHQGDTIHEILTDPARRGEHIRQVAAVSEQAHGVELNYERFGPESRDPFTAFVRDLRAAMPANRELSIVLQPKTTNASGSNGRAIDWRAIEPYAAAMRIMAYHYSYSTSAPGPVVPLDVLRRLADFALNDPEERIPRDKLSIILNLWGWDWPLEGDRRGRLVEWSEAMDLARSHGATIVRDPHEQTLHFRYVDSGGMPHEVWIDDAVSLRARVEVLRSAGVPRVDFWNLNSGDPAFWEWVLEETGGGEPVAPSAAPVDFGGDGRSDVSIFRASTGGWRVDGTRDGQTDLQASFGDARDVPVPKDYDGDGRADFAVFRRYSEGARWFVDVDRNGGTDLSMFYGSAGDIPVPGDYDGDGAADLAVFRPASGAWFVDVDRNGGTDLQVVFGQTGDVPLPADYDGDGATDLAVFRPSSGTWFVDVDRNGGGDFQVSYGASGDLPVPGDYDGDGAADLAVFRPAIGTWFLDTDRNGGTDLTVAYGRNGDVPVPGDFDRDGRWDLAVYRRSGGGWFIDTNGNGGTDSSVFYGGMESDVPLRENGWVLDTLGLTR